MITLNKLAKRCLETAMRKGKINNYTSRRAFILLISVKWRELLEASKYHSKHLPGYSEQEIAAAGINHFHHNLSKPYRMRKHRATDQGYDRVQ